VAESLRNVVAGLRFVDVEHTKRVLLLTSPSASEGKTSVSLGISITLAEVGNKVLYIEADLRRPKATQYTQLDGTVGLTSVLLGDHSLEDSVQQWGNPNLHVLLSGKLPPNPSQLLSSDQLRGLIAHAAQIYDYVIIDSAPVLPVADATWLTSLVDGTLLTVRVNRTTRQAVVRAVNLVDGGQAPLLGIIVNGGTDKSSSPYYAIDTPRRRSTRRRSAPGAGARAPRLSTLDDTQEVEARVDGGS
jgi:capsular exopolysaccharide synthesis family protein